MPFDPQQLDSLDDGSEPPEDPDELDEDEDDPSSWDLTSGRAGAHQLRYVTATELDVAQMIALVRDSINPDGSAASARARAAAMLAWKDKDPGLFQTLHVALTGTTPDGAQADWQERAEAGKYLDRRVKRWLQSGDAFAPPASASAQGRRPAGKHAVRITDAVGDVRLEQIGNDDAAVEEAAVRLSRLTIEELREPFKQGPQTDADRARRIRQAVTIIRLIDLGATQRAIGRVFELAPGRVSEQAALGRQVADRLG